MRKFKKNYEEIRREGFQQSRRNIKIIDGYPFKFRYKGRHFNEVAEKLKNDGIAVRVIRDVVFTEAGRVPDNIRLVQSKST